MITLTNGSIRRATKFGLAVMAVGVSAGLAAIAFGDSSAKAATCTIDWTGAGDGTSWTDPANWNGSLPGPTDHACIQPGSLVTVTHTTASTSISSLQTNAFASVDVATGTLSVTSPTDASTFGADLILSGSGDVSFAGPVSIAGDLVNSGLSAALLTFDGTTTVAGSVLFEDNASNEIGGSGTLTIAGDLDWEQGEFVAIPVTVAGTTTMYSISPKDIQNGAVVTLNGASNWTAGNITFLNDGSTLVNNGSMTITTTAAMNRSGGSSGLRFHNTSGGSINVATGSVVTIGGAVGPVFDNDGSLLLAPGSEWRALGGGTTTVPVDVPAGAIYEFGGGSVPHTHVWTAGSDVTGAGTVEFTSGVSTFDGGFNFAGDLVAIGGSAVISTATPNIDDVTLDGTGDITISGVATVAGNVVNTGTSSAVFTLNTGGTIAGDLTIEGQASNEIRGPGTLAVAGDLFWRLGEIAQIDVTIAGTSTLEGGDKELHEAGSLTLNGPSNWTAGNFEFYDNSSELINNGPMTITTTAAMNRSGGSSGLRFHNTSGGSINVATGSVVTIGGAVGPVFDNDGSLVLAPGSEWRALGGGTTTVPVDVPAGAIYEFGGGSVPHTHVWTAGSDVTGAGTVEFTSGVSTFDGGFNFAGDLVAIGGSAVINTTTPSLDDVTLDGTGDITISGVATVAGNVVNTGTSSAVFTLNTGGTIAGDLTIEGQASNEIRGPGTLAVAGDLFWRLGEIAQIDVTIAGTSTLEGGDKELHEAGSLTLNGPSNWTAGNFEFYDNSSELINNGPMTITTTAAMARLGGSSGMRFHNTSGGSINVATGSVVTIGGAVGPLFDNDGSLVLASGSEWRAIGGGTTTVPVDVPAGAIYEFGGGSVPHTQVWTAGSDVTGAGTVEFTSGVSTFDGGFNFAGDLVATNGSAEINTATPNLDDVTLNGSDDITISGTATIGGDVVNTGTSSAALILNSGGTIAGDLTIEGQASNEIRGAGTLAVAGDLFWRLGEIAQIDVTIAGTSTLEGGDKELHAAGSLTLNGPSNWTAGNIEFYDDNSELINNASMTITTTAAMARLGGTSGMRFHNTSGGSINVATGNTITIGSVLGPVFDNDGSLILAPGSEWRAIGGGTTTVPVNVPAGAIYEFGGGTAPHVHVWTLGSDLTGGGTVEFTSGSSTFDGGFNFAGDLVATNGSAEINTATPNLDDVTLDGSDDITISGTATIGGDVVNTGTSSAALILNSGGTIAGDLTIEGQASNEIRGTGTLAVAGDLFWRLGEIAQINVTIAGTSTLEGGAKELHAAGSLTLNGPSNWTAGNIEFYDDNSELINNASMTITTTAAMARLGGTSGMRFHNTSGGSINVATGSVVTIGSVLGPVFDNDGSLILAPGSEWRAIGGGTTTVPVNVPAGAIYEFGAGTSPHTHVWTATSDLIGGGTVEFTSGTSTFDGGFNFAGDLIATGGSAVINTTTPNLDDVTLDGTGDVTIGGAATIAGNVVNTGTSSALLILPTGGTIAGDLTIEGQASNEVRGAGTLAVAGDLFWRLGEIAQINVSIAGTSTLEGGAKELHDAGSLTLNGPSNWTAGNIEFYDDNSELINNASMTITTTAAMARLGGTSGMRFHNTSGGSINVATGNTITIGSSVGPSVLNDGLISLPAGSTLNALGGITQTASGTLRVGVLDATGPGVGTGLLTGLVDMVGTLEIDVDPSFTPVSQADYTIITSSGVGTDDFTTITDVASGLSGTPPTNTVDSLTHTWEVQYTLGVDVTLHTLNMFPVADPIGDQSIDEGTAIAPYPGSFGDADAGDTHTFLWQVSAGNGQIVPDATTQSFAFTPLDDGTYTVSFTVTDNLGKSDTVTSTVTATNVAPTMTVVTVNDGDEGSSVIGSVEWTDPGTLDTHDVEVDWDDGSGTETYNLATSPQSISHVYADDGAYTISVTVVDDDGGASASLTDSVTISNVAPTVTVTGAANVDEGTPYPVAVGPVVDPGDDTALSWDIDWGDGTNDNFGAPPVNPSHTYADNGAYTVEVTVTDEDGDFSGGTTEVTVDNVAPTITITEIDDGTEGTAVTGSVAWTDPGSADTHTATIDWGDGTTPQLIDPAVTSQALSHTYADNGNYTATITITDDDADSDTDTHDIIITNVAPTVTVTGAANVDEGTPYPVAVGPVVDPGDDTALSWDIDWGDGSSDTFGSAPVNPSHTYADNGAYTVEVTVTDEDGDFSAGSTSVIVDNVAPTITITEIDDGTEGTAVTGSVAWTDPGSADTHTATINWGDGTTPQLIDPAVTSQALSHTYADNGNYTATITITDDDADSDSDTHDITITNVAPTAVVTDPGPVAEGSPYAPSIADADDPGADTVTSWTVVWGDGSQDTYGQTAAPAADHVYADDGSYSVTVSVSDDDGTFPVGSLTATVTNVAPTIGALTIDDGTEGTSVSGSVSWADPGSADTFTVAIDWGDGTATQTIDPATSPQALSHTFADNGAFTTTVTVTDDDGGFDVDTHLVTIANVAPAVAPSGTPTVAEGALYTLTVGPVTDPGADTVQTWLIDWGDSTSDTITGATPPTPTHVYADDDGYTIDVSISDEDGTVLAGSTAVTVENAAPVVDSGGDRTVDEDTLIGLVGVSFTDAGTLDTHTATVDWGDESGAVAATVTETPTGPPGDLAGTTGTVSASHTYAQPGIYTVTVCVTDDELATGCDDFQMTVSDITAPVIALNGADPLVVEAGTTFTDPGAIVTDNVDADVPIFGAGTVDTNTVASYTLTYDHTDAAGNPATTANRTVIVVDTIAPVVTIATPADAANLEIGTVVNAAYSCTDSGSGIASCNGTVAVGQPIDTATLGLKSFTVTGTDNEGLVTAVTHNYEVVAAPDNTPPTVIITSPPDGAAYENGQPSVFAEFSCTDAESGVDDCLGELDDGVNPPIAVLDGDTIATFAGSYTLTVTGTDLVGNIAVESNSFTVVAGTPPTVTITTPPDGATYEIGTVVNASYDCTDAESEIISCTGNADDGAPIDTSTLGPIDFAVTGIDATSKSTTVTNTYTVVDTGDPIATITTPPDGTIYNIGDIVIADYTCADSGSGIDTCIGDVADGTPIDTTGFGNFTFTVTATDNAGNTDIATHNYSVIDPTPPIVTITTPSDGATYEIGAVVTAGYTCDDPETGIFSCDGTVANGTPIDTTTLGPIDFTVTGTNGAGLTTTVTHTYTVVAATDETAPVITITTPPDAATYEIGEVVNADFTCDDPETGVVSCDGTVADGTPIDTSTLGPIDFTVTGTNGAGLTTTVTHTYTVVDTGDPIATITTPPDGTIYNIGDPVTADYTCTDSGSGIETCVGNIADGATIDTTAPGNFTLVVTATDNAGNTDIATHNYSVIDPTPPVVTIDTPANDTTYEVDAVVNADYTCTDPETGIVTCDGPVPDGTPIDTTTLGPIDFTVTGTNGAGLITTVTHTYTVVDTTPPGLTLIGPDPFDVEIGTAFVDPGATVTDNLDEPRTVFSGDAVDTSVLGQTVITYDATDNAGNAATPITRMVNVVDTGDPTVDITTPPDGATYQIGEVVTADYACDDIGSGIASCVGTLPDGADIDTSTLGPFDFTVTATDNAGLTTTVTHSYTVVPGGDVTPPTVTITAPANGAAYEGGSALTAGYSCSDDGSGIASCIGDVADGAPLDTGSVGTFDFTVTATDNVGLTTTLTHTFSVVDTTPPTITLIGDDPLSVEIGGTFVDPGALVNDNVDTDRTVFTTDTVDTSLLGPIIVSYAAADVAGNVASNVTRTVMVVDTTPPTVTITTPADGAVFDVGQRVRADYECADGGSGLVSCDGPINDNAWLDTSTPGTYQFGVTATDAAGNPATLTHTYQVIAPSLATLTIEHPGVERVEVTVRQSDGIAGVATGAQVANSRRNANSTTFANLRYGTYDLVVNQDGTTIVIDNVVVAAPSVVVGSLVCTLSIDLGSLRNARVAVHATDGVVGSVSGSPAVRLGKQSGVIQIAVLRGTYDVQATVKGNRFVIDGIDCTGPTGTAMFPS